MRYRPPEGSGACPGRNDRSAETHAQREQHRGGAQKSWPVGKARDGPRHFRAVGVPVQQRDERDEKSLDGNPARPL